MHVDRWWWWVKCFTRRRSRNESRSLVAVRASIMAVKRKDGIEEKISRIWTDQHHVRFRLYEELIEQRAILWVFEHFEEDHGELFVILLSSKKMKLEFGSKERIPTNLFVKNTEIVSFIGQNFNIALNLYQRCEWMNANEFGHTSAIWRSNLFSSNCRSSFSRINFPICDSSKSWKEMWKNNLQSIECSTFSRDDRLYLLNSLRKRSRSSSKAFNWVS